MNEANTERRIEQHLRSSADRESVPISSPDHARRRARTRTVQRRRATVAGVAAASVAGAVVAVGVLSQPSSSTLRSSDDGGNEGVALPEVQAVPEPEVVAAPAQTTPAAPVSALPGVETIAAVAGDPAFVWKVVEPDKDAAIIGTFGESVDTFPGLGMSTAPGRSNDYDDIERVIWRTDDGISFEQTDLESPFGVAFWEPSVSGDSVFVVGTAPGVASSDPNRVEVAVTSLDDPAWDIIELPLESEIPSNLPMATSGTMVNRVVVDGGLLVAVTPNVGVDLEAVARANDVDISDFSFVSSGLEGISVQDRTCLEEIWEDGRPFATTTVLVEPGSPDGECPATEYSWDELGVPAETIAALDARRTDFFFVDTAGTATAVESPAPGSVFYVYGGIGRFIVESIDGSSPWNAGGVVEVFEFEGGEWTSSEMPSGQANFNSTPTEFLGGLAGIAYNPAGGEVFTMIADDGSITNVDLAALFDDGEEYVDSGGGRAAAVDDRLVSVIEQYPDLIARAGGVQLTVDGITVRQDTDGQQPYFVDAAGDRVSEERLRYGPTGGTIVMDALGDVIAEFSDQMMYDEMFAGVYDNIDGPIGPRTSLVTTADGVSFSVESVADLLGMDESDVNRVQRISTDGTTVVVAVALNERHEDESRKQLVLVGTPID